MPSCEKSHGESYDIQVHRFSDNCNLVLEVFSLVGASVI